jgi:hypothetical protein
MPRRMVSLNMPAPSSDVFALLHDYHRRLEWDTLLSDAYLVDGYQTAGVGAVSVCRGRWRVGHIPMKTRYISFEAPRLAAVELIAPVACFAKFAASIRHRDLTSETSMLEYVYAFTSRPNWLRGVLDPLIDKRLAAETRQRLNSLAQFLAKSV